MEERLERQHGFGVSHVEQELLAQCAHVQCNLLGLQQ